METFAEQIIHFQKNLNSSFSLSDGVDILKPYNQTDATTYAERFYRKYYADNIERTFIISISPHKYGAGLTGIPLTDAIRLEVDCGIPNRLPKHPDLSSEFMYQVISLFGGTQIFTKNFT